MKILVTGLYLSRNLGGPAMGLTLINELQKRFENLETNDFTFAVSPTNYEQEQLWAKRYGLKITGKDTLSTYILYNSGLRAIYRFVTRKYKSAKSQPQKSREFWLDVHQDYMKAFQEADLVIDLMGLSYIGDGVQAYKEGLNSYSSYYYAKKHNKPFIRFIQSFGPFDDWTVRVFAKNELNQLPFIPARGKNSAAYCRSLVTDKSKVYDFPDSAILLPSNEAFANDFLNTHNLGKKAYVVISPSAIIKNSLHITTGSVGEKHVESFVMFSKRLLDQGEKLVFLPHMYSDIKRHCDREVAREIMKSLDSENCLLIEDDLDPMEAKGIIEQSKYAIVSRYHALVAAASTGTPVITIGWNTKYQDLMEYYDIDDLVIDARLFEPEKLSDKVIEHVDFINNNQDDNCFHCLHGRAVKKVTHAFDLLSAWIEDAYHQ